MDPEIFLSLHLGNTEMLPVCAADADGAAVRPEVAMQACPVGLQRGAFLGRSVNLLLAPRSLRFTTIYETAMADSLKSMALKGWALRGCRI